MKKKGLFYCFQTREGWAYEPLPDEFYNLLEELINETERDAYFGRADNLQSIVEKIESYIFIGKVEE